MGGKRMAEGVRCYAFFDTGCQRMTANKLPEPLSGQRPARAVDKHKNTGTILGQSRPRALDVVEQLLPGPFPKRNSAHLRAFALDGQKISLKINLLHLQSDQFRNSQSGGIQKLQHRLITYP